MPNRSTEHLPAVFYNALPFFPQEGRPLKRSLLVVFDFTFLHFHDTLELGYCISGEGVCCVEDREYPFRAGDYQIIFPYQRHLSKNSGTRNGQWYWINVDPYRLLEGCGFTDLSQIEHLMGCEMGLCGIFSPEKYPAIAEICQAIFREAQQTDPTTLHREKMFALEIYRLLLHLARESEVLPKLSIQRDGRMLQLAPALEEIYRGVEEGVSPSVRSLAERCNMSESSFRRVFHPVVGLPPKDYIIDCFLRKAKKLLLTSQKSILEISAECGFDNISGFNRQFLSRIGVPPSEYRKQRENL